MKKNKNIFYLIVVGIVFVSLLSPKYSPLGLNILKKTFGKEKTDIKPDNINTTGIDRL